MAHTNHKLYIFDQDYCISRYFTIYAGDELEALRKLKSYLKDKAEHDKRKGYDYFTYHKWKSATPYDLPDNYRIEERDPLQVYEHERI